MSKIVTVTAAAVGYVLGARAGRERYAQIVINAKKVWGDPRVQKAASDAQQAAADKAPVVKDKFNDLASKVSDKATSGGSSTSGTPR
ncbi:MAG: hypothetical protein H0U77_11660 [Nocardioidaceae bacterium]|nr:hypothetical protein [Nocardioidaceae bacterium]